MGSTAAFATGATGETTRKLVAMKGSVPTWAAQVKAKGSLAQRGIHTRRRSTSGVRTMIATVPANDSWKPTSQASSGFQASIAAAVAASELQTWVGRPSRLATSARPPMQAARTAAGVAPPASA